MAWRVVRSETVSLEAGNAIGAIALPPLAERGPGDAAVATDNAGVADLLIKSDPAEPGKRIHSGSSPP